MGLKRAKWRQHRGYDHETLSARVDRRRAARDRRLGAGRLSTSASSSASPGRSNRSRRRWRTRPNSRSRRRRTRACCRAAPRSTRSAADSTCIDAAAATTAAERLVTSDNVVAIVGRRLLGRHHGHRQQRRDPERRGDGLALGDLAGAVDHRGQRLLLPHRAVGRPPGRGDDRRAQGPRRDGGRDHLHQQRLRQGPVGRLRAELHRRRRHGADQRAARGRQGRLLGRGRGALAPRAPST